MSISNVRKNGRKFFQALEVAVLLLVFLAPSAPASIGPSHFYRTNEVNGGLDEVPIRISQAEDVTLDLWTVDQAGTVTLPTNTVPVWFLSAKTNLSLVYIAATGTLQSATGGHSRVNWTWRNLIVPAQRYIGTVRGYQSAGGTNEYIGTLAQHYVDVSSVPDTNGYTTVVPTDLSKTVTSNQMGSGAIWNGSQWTFGVVAGSILGVTIAGGSSHSATTNSGIVELTVNTNVPAETDPLSSTSKVSKTGDTMSGDIVAANYSHNMALLTNAMNVKLGLQAAASDSGLGEDGGVGVGWQANGSSAGVAVGFNADASGTGVAVGWGSTGKQHGVAIGCLNEAIDYGVAVGFNNVASNYGVALGYMSFADRDGVAAGKTTHGEQNGAAFGKGADGSYYGVAVGRAAVGSHSNIAMGVAANSHPSNSALFRIAIGHAVTNQVNDSVALRGTLYLDGGANVFYRTNFGVGVWTDLLSGLATGTPLYVEADATALASGTAASNSFAARLAAVNLGGGTNAPAAWGAEPTGAVALAQAQAPNGAAVTNVPAAWTATGDPSWVTNPVSGTVGYYDGSKWLPLTNMFYLGTNFLFHWASTNSPARFPCDGE